MTNPRPPPRPDPPTPKARAKQKRNRQSPPPPSPKRRPPPRKPPPRTKPSSPTNSSRSKKSTPSSNVLTATSPRRPIRRRTLLTLDSIPIPPPHNVLSSTRLFGHEVQCLMHAFGEVRYCARPVLELVEDAVRTCVLRVARGAYENGDLTVAGVARALGGDLHSVARFNQATKDVRKEKIPHRPAAWELLTGISDVFPGDDRPLDLHFQATWRAQHAFRNAMGVQFQDWLQCRNTRFVKGESRSRAPRIRGVSRLALFRQWLSLPSSWSVGDDVFHALGHIAWECVGVITQTALMVRYWDDFAAGVGDPRRMDWTYGRHVIAALAYGLCTAVMIPLTDLQAASLKQEIDRYYVVSQTGANRWRGYTHASSPCLLPVHVREALRRLERRSDSVFGYRGSPLLAYGLDI